MSYKLFDGDYDPYNAPLLEKWLEHRAQLDGDAYECSINNADNFQTTRRLEILIRYHPPEWNDDGWEDEVLIDTLTDLDIGMLQQVIPDPGHGPYFRWVPNLGLWLSQIEDLLRDCGHWTASLQEAFDQYEAGFRRRFERGDTPQRMAALHIRYSRRFGQEPNLDDEDLPF